MLSFDFNFGCLPTPVRKKNNFFYDSFYHDPFKIKIDKVDVMIWSEIYKYDTISPYTIRVEHRFGTSFLCITENGLFDIQYITLPNHQINLLEYKRDEEIKFDEESQFMNREYDGIFFRNDTITKNGNFEKITLYNPYSCYVMINSKKFIYIINKITNDLHEIEWCDEPIEKIYKF